MSNFVIYCLIALDLAYTLSIVNDYKFRIISFWVIDDLRLSFRMLLLSIQLLVRWSGLMQRIHFFCSILVAALESQR
jgi:hypothetical protein